MGINARQFQEMQDRVSGRSRPRPEAVAGCGVEAISRLGAGSVVLGVDPSLRGTGYGVLRLARGGPEALAHGTIRCPAAWPRSRCFARIGEELRSVLRGHRPTVCVIEGLFFAQNLQTALLMGEARGAILLTLAEAGLEIYEMAPRKVKQAIVGYGGAQKEAVARMVQRMLKLSEQPEPDAADALALALACVQGQSRYSLSQPRKI